MNKNILTIADIKKTVGELAKKYEVERVYLFGSYARGEANENSDIDFRIDRGELRGLFQLSGFNLDLEENLNTKVDILTTESLDDSFLKRIGREEIIIYENKG